MTSIQATAPGKAVLSGEYAVLRGAPAISAAIDRRAVVEVVATDARFHSVSTPGYAEGLWHFTADSTGRIEWLDERPAQGLDLIEQGWRAMTPAARSGLSLTVDTTAFNAADGAAKLGLGGSAAAMTALVAALDRLAPGKTSIFRSASGAHKALQQGLGSGVDVATSCVGGVIEFKAGATDEPLQHDWPDGLRFCFLWSGTSASTKEKIAGLDIGSTDVDNWQPLISAAESAAVTWATGDVSRIVDDFGRYADTLRQFSIDHDLGIFDAGHAELADMAVSAGLVYKPCGAGGGDIGIVMAGDRGDAGRKLNQFCDRAEASGFQLLSLLPDPNGVTVSGGDES